MQSYLAAKYMSGPKADAILSRAGVGKKKKRARDGPASTRIVDDDAGFGAEPDLQEEPVEDVIVASDRSFKKRSDSSQAGWTTVREPTPPPAPDEMPIVVDSEPPPRKAGLITAAELRRDRLRQEKPKEKDQPTEQEQETVYRDASGRRIDTKAERAEAARLKREREEKEAQKMEWGKGVVQRAEEEQRRVQLALESTRDLARYADDAELNESMKAQERWNDPALAFIDKSKSKGPRRPEYKGPPPPPNRFGIKPGYRWDGVDRSNGFEKKFFQKINDRARHGAASHEWSVEDM